MGGRPLRENSSATAFLGSLSFVRRPLGGPFFAASFGWLLVTVVFFGLELVTPIEISSRAITSSEAQGQSVFTSVNSYVQFAGPLTLLTTTT